MDKLILSLLIVLLVEVKMLDVKKNVKDYTSNWNYLLIISERLKMFIDHFFKVI